MFPHGWKRDKYMPIVKPGYYQSVRGYSCWLCGIDRESHDCKPDNLGLISSSRAGGAGQRFGGSEESKLDHQSWGVFVLSCCRSTILRKTWKCTSYAHGLETHVGYKDACSYTGDQCHWLWLMLSGKHMTGHRDIQKSPSPPKQGNSWVLHFFSPFLASTCTDSLLGLVACNQLM